jgi:hypothetical protein
MGTNVNQANPDILESYLLDPTFGGNNGHFYPLRPIAEEDDSQASADGLLGESTVDIVNAGYQLIAEGYDNISRPAKALNLYIQANIPVNLC